MVCLWRLSPKVIFFTKAKGSKLKMEALTPIIGSLFRCLCGCTRMRGKLGCVLINSTYINLIFPSTHHIDVYRGSENLIKVY